MAHSKGLLGRNADAVLGERLHRLGDPQFMKMILGTALQHLIRERVAIEACNIEYCKMRPSQHIALSLRLTLRGEETNETSRQHVSCTIRPDLSTARAQFQEEISQLNRSLAGSADQHRDEQPIALVPEMAMLVRLFPFDPVLSGLGPATDVPRMLALLRTHLPECRDDGWWPSELRYEVVHYRPERQCTLRYTVKLEHSESPAAVFRELFGKVFSDERWRLCYEFQTAAWEAACASDGVWRTAKQVASVPEWRFVLQEAVTGQRFRHVFGELTQDDAGELELAEAERHVSAVARAVRSMQLSPIRIGPQLGFPQLRASLERNLVNLEHSAPRLAAELTRLSGALSQVETAIPSQPLGLAHGDFAQGNLLLDDGVVGIIDFDLASQAEPAYDVACFLTHLTFFGIRRPKRQPHVARLSKAFRAAYLSLAPEVSPRRLALYEALDLSAHLLRSFRKRGHHPKWSLWAEAQTEQAWARLDFASTACAS